MPRFAAFYLKMFVCRLGLPWQTNKIFAIAVILSEYSGRSAKRNLYIVQLYHGPGAVSTGDLRKRRDR